MRIDCHIHSNAADAGRGDILSKMKEGGFDGGIVFSQSPGKAKGSPDAEKRMEAVLKICEGKKYLFPFYWIDPTEPDAPGQIELAGRKGIMGYKTICSSHHPCDARAMPVYAGIAAQNKPLMFHSGILYDGRNASGEYNRPCGFEGLLSVDGLRFSLAHVSWPWTDECTAVYGKFNNALSHQKEGAPSGEMFIDLTPGTPKPYRKPMYEKLLFSGYSIKKNLLYGIDNRTGPYDSGYSKSWLDFDEGIFDGFEKGGGMYGIKLDGDFLEHLYFKNAMRFIGLPENY
ncbi:MAG: hypothetical protein FWG34_00735 [Oscillospiraceae bacterium]|nr:hypothetical protein [Oscillospiraceae bacterium]